MPPAKRKYPEGEELRALLEQLTTDKPEEQRDKAFTQIHDLASSVENQEQLWNEPLLRNAILANIKDDQPEATGRHQQTPVAFPAHALEGSIL